MSLNHGDHEDLHSNERTPLAKGVVSSYDFSLGTGNQTQKQAKMCLQRDQDDVNKYRKNRNRLIIASLLCLAFMVVEVIGGVLANSLAVMSDAAHLLSDLAGFLISLAAIMLARRRPTSKLSFGFHRVEIIGAIISILLIWILTGVLFVEAVERVQNPPEVDGKIMVIVSGIGIAVNIVLGLVLYQSGHSHSHGGLPVDHNHSHGFGGKKSNPESRTEKGHGHSHGKSDSHGHDDHDDHDHEEGEHGHGHGHGHEKEDNINVRSAFVHVIGDTVQTIGVLIAGIIIMVNPEYKIADPLCTFLFSIIVLFTTITIIRDALHVLMEGTPTGINMQDLTNDLLRINGVVGVHGLHAWSITIGRPALSVHVVVSKSSGRDTVDVLREAENSVCSAYNIHHTTIQVEYDQLENDKDGTHCGNCCETEGNQ